VNFWATTETANLERSRAIRPRNEPPNFSLGRLPKVTLDVRKAGDQAVSGA